MSHTKEEVEFTLKVVINKHATKVLFAEIDSNFADVLLSFLTLPLGTIIRLLVNQYEEADIGSLTSLYNGLSNLDSRHFSTEGVKMTLINLRSSFEAEYRKLKHDINDTKPTKYYACQDLDCVSSRESNICMYYDTAVCDCGQPVAREFYYMTNNLDSGYDDGGVFTRNGAYFLISDDLQMVPSVEGSVMETLSILGITDMDEAEAQLRNVAFGFNKVIDLLKGSLLSSTPLSDIILGENRKYYSEEKPPAGRVLFHGTEKESTTSSNSKKMILKLMLKKSTIESLFAQCEDDFIDFLFSLLTIPLGGVENLLGGNTCLKNIDNLYTSLENINGDKYLRNPDTKSRLINPTMPHGYMSKNMILPLREEIAPTMYYHQGVALDTEWISESIWNEVRDGLAVEFPEGMGSYVREGGPTMYMVTHDLTVTPLCMYSTLSILNEMKVPFVREYYIIEFS